MFVKEINQQKVNQWLKAFPGGLNNTGDVPVHRRGNGY